MEDISVFDINSFSKELQKFGEDWTMFEEKPKPAAPAGSAQVDLATKKKKIEDKDDNKEIKRLKEKAGSEKFTTTSFQAFSKEVEAAT